jgi:HEAT repeat protein
MIWQTALIGIGIAAVTWAASLPEAAAQRRAPKPKLPEVDIAAETARLADKDPAVAIAGAQELAKAAPDPVALGALLDALALGLHPKAAAAALDAIAAFGDRSAYSTVAFYLTYRDPRVRAAAVRAIGALDDPRGTGAVIEGLHDTDKQVRAAAIETVAQRNIRRGIEPMMELLKKGDEATAPALAAMADPDLARTLGEYIGTAPDFLLARALGLILLRQDFKPETARVQVVRTLGKVPGAEVIEQLTAYIESVPAKPPRQSRREAQAFIEARLSGDK